MSLVTLERAERDDDLDENDGDVVGADKVNQHGDYLERRPSRRRSENFFVSLYGALGLQNTLHESSIAGRRSSVIGPENADLQSHLKRILSIIRPEDRIKIIVKLHSQSAPSNGNTSSPTTSSATENGDNTTTRYFCLISCATNDIPEPDGEEEHAILGVDVVSSWTGGNLLKKHRGQRAQYKCQMNGICVGLVEGVFQDVRVDLTGEGRVKLVSPRREVVLKPVSIPALWSAVTRLRQALDVAARNGHRAEGQSHSWLRYYEALVQSNSQNQRMPCSEWTRLNDIEVSREDLLPKTVENPTECDLLQQEISRHLQKLMYEAEDLDSVTVVQLRKDCEAYLGRSLVEFRDFINEESVRIYGQMDQASEIFSHLFLGSSYNASNLRELQERRVSHILNVTKEVDNFFEGLPNCNFAYKNVRIYDEETSHLLREWQDTHRFINEAKKGQTCCLVHCRMGVSRSASTVIAYAMKEYGWSLEKAFNYVKERRACILPNSGFMAQLLEYEGILAAGRATFLTENNNDTSSTSAVAPSAEESASNKTPEASEERDVLNSPKILEVAAFGYRSPPDWTSNESCDGDTRSTMTTATDDSCTDKVLPQTTSVSHVSAQLPLAPHEEKLLGLYRMKRNEWAEIRSPYRTSNPLDSGEPRRRQQNQYRRDEWVSPGKGLHRSNTAPSLLPLRDPDASFIRRCPPLRCSDFEAKPQSSITPSDFSKTEVATSFPNDVTPTASSPKRPFVVLRPLSFADVPEDRELSSIALQDVSLRPAASLPQVQPDELQHIRSKEGIDAESIRPVKELVSRWSASDLPLPVYGDNATNRFNKSWLQDDSFNKLVRYYELKVNQKQGSPNSLHYIALRYNFTVWELKNINGLVRDQDFFALRKLKIPALVNSYRAELLEKDGCRLLKDTYDSGSPLSSASSPSTSSPGPLVTQFPRIASFHESLLSTNENSARTSTVISPPTQSPAPHSLNTNILSPELRHLEVERIKTRDLYCGMSTQFVLLLLIVVVVGIPLIAVLALWRPATHSSS